MLVEHVQPSAVTSMSAEANIFAFCTGPQKKSLPTMPSTAGDEEEAEVAVAVAVEAEEEGEEEEPLVPSPLPELPLLLLQPRQTIKTPQQMLGQVAALQ